jgi:hypothetical protein
MDTARAFAALIVGVPGSVGQGRWVLVLTFVGTLVGLLVAVELGRWVGRRQRAAGQGNTDAGVGAMDGAVFALFGLLLAFVFFAAATRFDRRRELITSVATAVNTAYLRVDLLPSDSQPQVRALFRRYVESLLAISRDSQTLEAAMRAYDRTTSLQDELWNVSVSAAQRNPPGFGLVVSSLNDMIALTTTRLAVATTHTPPPIFMLLFGLAFLCAVLAGRGTAASMQRQWLNTLVFALAVAISMYTIVDFEFPRLGLVKIDTADRLLVELLASMQ